MRHSFLDKYSGLDSPIHHLDARTKILSLFCLVVICVSTPPTAYLAFLACFLLLVTAVALSRVPPGYILKRSLIIVPFVLMVAVFIPFLKPNGTVGSSYNLGIGSLTVYSSGLLVLWNVLIKSYIAVLSMILLSSTTPFSKLLRGFEQLHIPKIFIMLASFAYRYIFVLVDETERMKRARDARCYGGKWLWHSKTIGQMIGTLFLRSYERAERVYVAMVSRGFRGTTASALGKSRLDLTDYLVTATAIGLLITFRIVLP